MHDTSKHAKLQYVLTNKSNFELSYNMLRLLDFHEPRFHSLPASPKVGTYCKTTCFALAFQISFAQTRCFIGIFSYFRLRKCSLQLRSCGQALLEITTFCKQVLPPTQVKHISETTTGKISLKVLISRLILKLVTVNVNQRMTIM